jgi:(heptosyl)LPS beta-1,4-glucosyltransferase
MKTQLTAIVLTYNEAQHIRECIETLRFADAVIVFDSVSTDATTALAREAGAQVIHHPFKDYASQRNAALDAVRERTEWVFFVDADERVPPALADEVRSVLDQPGIAGWRVSRHNYIFGRITRGAGWYPDYQTRLLRVGAARYDPERQVHEVVQLDGELGTLIEPLTHFNYRDAAQFAEKQRRYAAYEARILYEQGVRPKPHNYILQPYRQFKWRFFELKGYQDGLHGLRLSALMAWYELRKYLKLHQMWRESRAGSKPTASDTGQ